jgi:hypothetical protein
LEKQIENEAPLEKDCYEIGRKIFNMSLDKFQKIFIDKEGPFNLAKYYSQKKDYKDIKMEEFKENEGNNKVKIS